jgi:hypothetical protein
VARRPSAPTPTAFQSTALLHQHLTDAEFGSCAGRGEQMDGSQVIHFALEAITRAAARP